MRRQNGHAGKMQTDPIPTHTKTETLSTRLDVDASDVVRKRMEAWCLPSPQVASALILIGAATVNDDRVAADNLVRWLQSLDGAAAGRLAVVMSKPGALKTTRRGKK